MKRKETNKFEWQLTGERPRVRPKKKWIDRRSIARFRRTRRKRSEVKDKKRDGVGLEKEATKTLTELLSYMVMISKD